jgi:hypothetical protein
MAVPGAERLVQRPADGCFAPEKAGVRSSPAGAVESRPLRSLGVGSTAHESSPGIGRAARALRFGYQQRYNADALAPKAECRIEGQAALSRGPPETTAVDEREH